MQIVQQALPSHLSHLHMHFLGPQNHQRTARKEGITFLTGVLIMRSRPGEI